MSVASANPALAAFGIDDFSFQDGARNREKAEATRAALGLANARLLAMTYETAMAQLPALTDGRKIGVFFVDGPHDYRSQLLCLLLALPHLAEGAVIVVDDSNYAHVRLANRDFLAAHPDFSLVFEAYTPCHPKRASPQLQQAARAGWWNGVNVMVHDPAGVLQRRLPQQSPAAEEFQLQDHRLHAMRMMPAAAEVLQVADALLADGLRGLPAALKQLFARMRTVRPMLRGAPAHLHTYSDGLETRFAQRTED